MQRLGLYRERKGLSTYSTAVEEDDMAPCKQYGLPDVILTFPEM